MGISPVRRVLDQTTTGTRPWQRATSWFRHFPGARHELLATTSRSALTSASPSGQLRLQVRSSFNDLIDVDLHYRNRQLKRLQKEILDLEDFDEESISLADFSLDDFRLELLHYLKANEALLESAPDGLHAVVPPDPSLPAARPGALFCLRHKTPEKPKDSTLINPLDPHYLVYLLDDGSVRLTFAQPKQCLQLFRELCAGKATATATLCDLFDRETKQGKEMDRYSDLLEKAVASIRHTFTKRAASSLLSSRDGKLPQKAETPTSTADFELVTWLVIKEQSAK